VAAGEPGEFLVIKGLKGFEQIDLELDAKNLERQHQNP
jgi:hypothetical protein